MGDLEKMQPRPFKRISLRPLGQFSQDAAGKHKDAAPRRLYWRSLKGMGKSIQMIRAPTTRPTPQLIIRMSFQLAIPWRVAPPALPASASPAGADSAARLAQLWGYAKERK